MHYTYSKATTTTPVVESRQVLLFINDQLYSVEGAWRWQLHSSQLYCSEVMYFPQQFDGTKAIIHPDDIGRLRSYLEVSSPDDTADLEFRIITTYGQVETISGDELVLQPVEKELAGADAPRLLFEQVKHEIELEKENFRLQHFKKCVALLERLTHAGCWYFNASSTEAFYSDNSFRLYGLLPQSLNAQLHTFAHFIHPQDKDIVLDTIDSSIRRKVPIDIRYRIITVDEITKDVQLTTHVHDSEVGETVFYGIMRDISQEARYEQQLEVGQEELKFHSSLLRFTEQTEDVAHWQVNLLTRKLSYSDNYTRLFGTKAAPGAPITFTNLVQYVHPDDQEMVQLAHNSIIEKHTPPDIEFRVIRADGKIRMLRQRGKLITFGKAELLMAGTLKDITYEHSLKEKLYYHSTEGYLKELTHQHAEELAGMAGFYRNTSTGVIVWGSNVFSLLGVRVVGDFSLSNFLRYVHPDERDTFKHIMQDVEKTGEPAEYHLRLATRGETKNLVAAFKIVATEQGNILICVMRDVTAQVRLQHQLLERLQFINVLSDSLQDKVLVTDITHSIVEWNHACETGFGRKKAEVLFKNYFDIFPELKDETIMEGIRHALAGKQTTFSKVSSTYLKGFHNMRLSPLHDAQHNVVGVMHLFTDVTRETVLERNLQDKIDFIENLVEASVDPIMVLDRNLNYIYWNRKSEEFFRINKEFAIGRNLLELLPDTKNNPTHIHFRQALAGQTVYIEPSENDEQVYREVYLLPVKDGQGKVNGIMWMLHDLTKEYTLVQEHQHAKQQLEQDVTARMQTEQELMQSKEFIEQVMQATPDYIMVFNLLENKLDFVNKYAYGDDEERFEETLRLDIEGILARAHPDDREPLLAYINSFRDEPTGQIKTIEYRVLKDNEEMWYCARGKVFKRDESGHPTHYLSIVQEITDRKNTEIELDRLRGQSE